jgi:hypothetical protein
VRPSRSLILAAWPVAILLAWLGIIAVTYRGAPDWNWDDLLAPALGSCATAWQWLLLKREWSVDGQEGPASRVLPVLAGGAVVWVLLGAWSALFVVGPPWWWGSGAWVTLLSLATARASVRGARWTRCLVLAPEKRRGDLLASILSRAALALGSLLLATGALELAARALSPAPRSSAVNVFGARDDFVVAPYVMFAEPDTAHGGTLNAQGFTGQPWPLAKSPHERRVALLGGSVVWVGGDQTSIAAELQRRLSRSLPDLTVRVANFGRRSYVSMQELIVLSRSVLALDIDLLVIFDGFNDLFVPYRGEPVGRPFLFSELERLTQRPPLSIAGARLVAAMALKSDAVALLRDMIVTPPLARDFPPELVATEYERNLRHMSLLARAHGARVLICPQPWVGSKQLPTPRELTILANLEQGRDLFHRSYALQIEAARRAAESTGAEFLNGTRFFDGVPTQVFSDPVHVHKYHGNRPIARRLWHAILKRGLLDSGRSAVSQSE